MKSKEDMQRNDSLIVLETNSSIDSFDEHDSEDSSRVGGPKDSSKDKNLAIVSFF